MTGGFFVYLIGSFQMDGDDMAIVTEILKFGQVIDDIIKAFPDYGERLAKTYDSELDFVRKSAASDILETPGDRVIIGRITTNSVDRDSDVVLPQGGQFEDYLKNPVVLWSHDYGGSLFGGTTYQLPHARNMWLRQFPSRNPKEIRAATQYASKEMNEFGDQVYRYRLAKWPLGYSIGFIPIQTIYDDDEEWDKTLAAWKRRVADDTEIDIETIKEPERFFTRWQLLEYSDVKIPCNQDAVQMMISKGLMAENERDRYTIKTESSDDLGNEYLPIEKPYPNEHACRLRDPNDFQDGHWSRSSREHEGKRYDVIRGRLKGETTTTEQAYRYPKAIWTVSSARSHCKSHDGISFEAASEEESLISGITLSVKEELGIYKQELADLLDRIVLFEGTINRDEIIDEGFSIDPEAIARAFGNELEGDDTPETITQSIDKVFGK